MQFRKCIKVTSSLKFEQSPNITDKSISAYDPSSTEVVVGRSRRWGGGASEHLIWVELLW